MQHAKDSGTGPRSANWYRREPDEVLAALESRPGGLSDVEARERLARHGHNELTVRKRSALVRLLLQFHNAMIYILLAAACVTGLLLGERVDTLVILGVVVLNVIIGFVQEGKAESAIEALKRMIVAESTVLRDGQRRVVPTRELVPGDVVLLDGGARVPADLRLLQARNLHVDESPLTGESVPAGKHSATLDQGGLGPGDQRNMAFSGTFVTRGTGQGVVVATGQRTEFGRIAEMMQATPKIVTPLVRKIDEFTRVLIIAILVLAAANFGLGLLFDFPVGYSFLASVALAVAAIPEMLPAIVVAILALASTAMARRRALIRKLPAAETLGCASVICSDKTGTLTRNEMTVVRLFAGGRRYRVTGSGYDPAGQFTRDGAMVDLEVEPAELRETLRAAAWCSDTVLELRDGRHVVVGDPTEGALVVAAAKGGVPGAGASRLDEIPFESENRYMATLHEQADHNLILVKGSPEAVLGLCDTALVGGVPVPLEPQAVLAEAEDMAHEALRVLGKAYKKVPKEQARLTAADLRGLTFLGLAGMIDPPRVEVIEAVRKCRSAGIRVVMITGDHAITARAIARSIGIIDGAGEVLTGESLEAMDDEALYAAVPRVSVYARSAPEHKLRIAQQLQRHGAIVAMTGDGVNDAPALKAADIGVAMGIAGTEVSKESADMVLADDNFASIVAAIEEGRHAWRNFQKAVLYTLPTNGGQALLVMGAIALAPLLALFSVRLPLEPIHILWVNLADSVFLTLPLMMEPKETGLLEGPPRDPGEPIANRLFIERVLLVSVLMAATGFATYYWFGAAAITAGPGGHDVDPLLVTQAQTAAFISIQLLHLGFLATARSVHRSAFTFSPFSNPWVLAGMGVTILCQLLIVYVPALQAVFRTAALPLEWWPIILLGLFPGFIGVEIDKALRRRAAATAQA